MPAANTPDQGDELEGGPELVGRAGLVAEVRALLADGRSVLLVGPADVGKTAIAHAVAPEFRELAVVDPLAHVHSREAARIRRGLERGACYLAAARTLDRAALGAVRRIAFWFTNVRVPPLTHAPMRRLVDLAFEQRALPAGVAGAVWQDRLIQLAAGRPGRALAAIETAALLWKQRGALPSADFVYLESRIRRAAVEGGRAPDAIAVPGIAGTLRTRDDTGD